ncbi:hypothetical protein ACFOWU_06955 [Epilithonimonas zeae]|uniref:Uncharacterized protein n=1 Tax=Epilithonimonas zeae TaxID=1416779 RepID=A0A1N6FT43_9FLAO|nr:hypothetical protein [Epilithonimonas zeae]SIN98392.1 hypothetical protein SAMN05444409_1460 [Epilithonimonas zeae]
MENKTKGSWLIHHTNKLQTFASQNGYNDTYVAGKAGILLSAVSANDSINVSNEKLDVLASVANINIPFELPKLLDILEEQQLIEKSKTGIAVLGVTTETTLLHTSTIFEDLNPSSIELASLDLAERASITPILYKDIAEEISDIYQLSEKDTTKLFTDAEQIGFTDIENISDDEKLLFNGNLFRRDTAEKIKTVLDSLKPSEQLKLIELNEILGKNACVEIIFAENILGKELFQKVTAIGLYDVSVVSNSKEDAGYITLPSAFSKYSNSMVDDAFDLAKAFISSITYGMTKSPSARGQIQMVDALLSTLVRGEKVGPVPAIAEDYKILELKGVVKVSHGQKKGRSGPMLELLKKEVGELALQAIRQGDVSEHSLTALPSAAVTKFNGPEFNRENMRRKQIKQSPSATNDMLSILRTGK